MTVPRLTYANVASTLALFGVIAGGTAAALPGKKTVQANDLKRNSVKAAAVASGAVRASGVRNGAVAGREVADRGLGYEDLGSNSVVARIRTTGSTQSGDGGEANPVALDLSGDQWTQGPNETDVFFGEATYTEPPACTGMGFPHLTLDILVNGERITREFLDADPGQTVTRPILEERPFLFEPESARPRAMAARISDDCGGAGQQYRLESLQVNAIAIR